MKRILFFCTSFFLFATSTFAQTNKAFDYTKHWQTVTDFEKKDLPQSALKEVNTIYTEAKNTNNTGQLVKAVIHQLKYTEYKEKEAFEKNIEKVKAEIQAAKFPTKQILHSMLAEMYWQYYTNNRWKFNDRTATVNFEQADIATWSLDKIVGETQKHYQLSLDDNEKAKKTKIEAYNEIINGGNELGQMLRPTLYDFLAHRAADFFMGEEPNLTQPSYAFKLDSESHFADAATFAATSITSKDSSSIKLQALQILQTLLQLHLLDKDPSALVDADVKRLKFVYQHSVNENKQTLYLQALQQLEQMYIKYEISTLVSYEIAKVYQTKGALYTPLTSDKYQFDLKKAYEIAEGAVKRFPRTFGAGLCQELQRHLLEKEVSISMEKICIPNQPILINLNYKNLDTIYWKAIKISKQELVEQREKWKMVTDVNVEQKVIEYFLNKPFLKQKMAILPLEGDLQPHITKLKMDGLDCGLYLIMISQKERNNNLCYAFTQVSNIAYSQRLTGENVREIQLMNRKSGSPLKGAQLIVSNRIYNPKNNKYEKEFFGTYTSDKDGEIKIPHKAGLNNELTFEFHYKDDVLSSDELTTGSDWSYMYLPRSEKPNSYKDCILFADRAIYRPGQTIFFKGLYIDNDGKKSNIIGNQSITGTLYDNNNQEVSKQDFITNEFGTFQGNFTLPTNKVGLMHIGANVGGQVYFSVEEYKRPKFEVAFEPMNKTFRLGDTITVVGYAKAYSGANIDGAKVKYRVYRNAHFPDWWCFWRGYYPNTPQVELANGVLQTDGTGKYTITFVAKPDLTLDRAADPTFTYTVHAFVTDVNGETQTVRSEIQVGYKAISLTVVLPDLDKDTKDLGKKEFSIATQNLASVFIPAKGNIAIYKLKTPNRAYKQKGQRSDKFVITKEQYQKDFPDEAYNDEDNIAKWEREQKVLTLNFDTDKQKAFVLHEIAKWTSGQYLLEATATDSYGQEVKYISYFKVYSSKETKLAIPEINYLQELKTTCEPGDTAKILLGTSADKINVLYEIEQDGKIINNQCLTLKNEQKILKIPIVESHRGNIIVYTTFVLENRFYQNTTTITVPYSNKELDISFETFRDKLLPGEKEQWKIKIKGKTADKISAEMVATLYDASLDIFNPHNWQANFFKSVFATRNWTAETNFGHYNLHNLNDYFYPANYHESNQISIPNYFNLRWFGYEIRNIRNRDHEVFDEVVSIGYSNNSPRAQSSVGKSMAAKVSMDSNKEEDNSIKAPTLPQIQPRKNFNETAFFYPNLYTNEAGEIIINFTVPEALTRWKMLGFAHTKDLKFGLISKELVTQKELMVVPNQPRFFRENDKMQFSVKITSLSDKPLTGQAQLEFFDALTMKPVNIEMKNQALKKNFSVAAGTSTQLEWAIEIPEGLQAITYRVVAQAGNFSDGEEMTLPVVTNRMLVTESMPMSIRGKQTKTFHFDKLKNNTSTTLRNHKYTLEFTSNPAWNAVLALPYLIEYPYECVEHMFNRFYANSIASHVANANPKIKRVFDTWATIQPDALLSNLGKNQELKSALLEETPWVLQAKDESQRKRNVALLFDLNRLSNQKASSFENLKKAQTASGGFSWFVGMPPDRYITQHIVAGIGHLDNIWADTIKTNEQIWNMVKAGIQFMDDQIKEDYESLKSLEKKNKIKMNEYQPDYVQVHYLSSRSYFEDIPVEKSHKEAIDYYLSQAKKSWTKYNLYMQGMLCLAFSRNKDNVLPLQMIKSFKERALHSDEMGMYWKIISGYYWHEAPIETQALMIEVFDEVAGDTASVEELKIWLLKQKQTQDWKTTKATAEACYALLLKGTDQLTSTTPVEITVGKENLSAKIAEETKVEAGTGYFKTSWTAPRILPNMGNVTVTKKDEGIAWGAVYWQYFEQLDKITSAETPLKLNKKLFLEKSTDRGPVITPIGLDTKLQVGDLIKVRIELRADRNMEYIHLKDMRASALEPVSTLSTYKYQDGLGYYESTRDLATNFFIGYLPKGTYVFEYSLRVSQKGDFSNGVTTVQSMYAPEFTSHSEGVRILVK